MDIMVQDIRRAGFVTSYPDTTANFALLQNNPFFDATTAGATTDIAIYNSNSCIVYSYNRDEEEDNGASSPAGIETPPAVDNDERLGFMLSGVILKMRKYGATNEDCSNGSEWETISEPEVEITGLTFTLAESPLNVTAMSDGTGDANGNGLCDTGETCNTCTRDGTAPDPACLYVRKVTISLSARLRDDNTVTQTITEQVRVRNDKFLQEL
jgi:type IV pilus assembly protein PilW